MNGDAAHYETDSGRGNGPTGKFSGNAPSNTEIGAGKEVMVGYQGLSARLDEFVRRKELEFRQQNQAVADCDEYFFSVSGLPKGWEDSQHLELEVNAKYSVHRHTDGSGFTVTLFPKDEIAKLEQRRSYEITYLIMARDGSIEDYHEAAKAVALKGGAFRIHVAPGFNLSDAQPGVLPPEMERSEAIERAESLVNDLIKGGSLFQVTKAASVSAARRL